MTQYEKIITINDLEKDVIINCVKLLLNLMFENTPSPIYFRLRLKDSEKNPFAKDLLLEWLDSNVE